MKREQLARVMDVLEQISTGGVGVDGPTVEELKAVERGGRVYEGDGTYHTTQKAWRMLERRLPQCRQNWKK